MAANYKLARIDEYGAHLEFQGQGSPFPAKLWIPSETHTLGDPLTLPVLDDLSWGEFYSVYLYPPQRHGETTTETEARRTLTALSATDSHSGRPGVVEIGDGTTGADATSLRATVAGSSAAEGGERQASSIGDAAASRILASTAGDRERRKLSTHRSKDGTDDAKRTP